MSTFVLVHGAWHGGWCWDDVAGRLRRAGHVVVAPTLLGLAEREGELRPDVGLSDHAKEVADVLSGLPAPPEDVVVVGHSYGGLVVREAVDRLGGAAGSIVLIDGWAGPDGASLLSLAPAWFADGLRNAAREQGDGGLLEPPPPVAVGIEDPAVAEAVAPRLTRHPIRSFEQPTRLTGAVDRVPGRAILCRDRFGLGFDRLAGELGYPAVRLDTGHDAMLTEPGEVAALLAA